MYQQRDNIPADMITAARRLFVTGNGLRCKAKVMKSKGGEGEIEALEDQQVNVSTKRVDEQWRTDNHLESLQASLNTQVCYRGFVVYRRQADS